MNRSDVISALKSEHKTLAHRLSQVEVALQAFGVNVGNGGPASPPSTQKKSTSRKRKRVLQPGNLETEIRSVLSQAGGPLMAREIHNRGTFAQSSSAIPHACNRMKDVESTLVDGHRYYSLRPDQ